MKKSRSCPSHKVNRIGTAVAGRDNSRQFRRSAGRIGRDHLAGVCRRWHDAGRAQCQTTDAASAVGPARGRARGRRKPARSRRRDEPAGRRDQGRPLRPGAGVHRPAALFGPRPPEGARLGAPVTSSAVQPFSSTTCTWGTATTLACPQVHWARNGHSHPQIYFVDHTSSAWPVSAAVPVWNQAQGVDSWYRRANCPNISGTHCVHVFNSDYGDTGWVGYTIFQYDSNRNFLENDTIVSLNDHYSITAARHRKSTCHELGHVLGLGHNSSATSCLISGDYSPQTPNSDDFALAANIYNSF